MANTSAELSHFAKNLRRLRLQRKPYLSQERLAQAVGIGRTTYINYELGRRMPPAWVVYQIASYFAVSVETLFRKG